VLKAVIVFVHGGSMYALNINNNPFNVSNDENYSGFIKEPSANYSDANYRFLKLIAEFDRRQAWSGYGLRSCAHWLNWKCGHLEK
jgi:hypothetical protein